MDAMVASLTPNGRCTLIRINHLHEISVHTLHEAIHYSNYIHVYTFATTSTDFNHVIIKTPYTHFCGVLTFVADYTKRSQEVGKCQMVLLANLLCIFAASGSDLEGIGQLD